MSGIDFTELKQSFVNSSLAILSKSESCVLTLESSFDKNAIDELFRGIHTIKGNSGIFELEKIPELSHAFENVLNLLRTSRLTPDPDLIDLMLLGIDRLKEMISSLGTSELIEIKDLVQKFNSYLGKQDENSSPYETNIIQQNTEKEKKEPETNEINVSEKIIAFAKNKKKYLSIVVFNLSKQKFSSLTEFLEKIQLVIKSSRILRKGLVIKKLKSLDSEEGPSLPYYLILLSESKVEPILAEADIEAEFIRTVFVPDSAKETNIAPEKETYTEKNTKQANPSSPPKEVFSSVPIDTSINVNLNLLNHLINLTGEIVLARNVLALKVLQSGNPELQSISKRFEKLLSELESGILKTRLQSMNVFFQKIPRLVRDIAKTTGKQVEVLIEGSDVELDKSLIDQLGDPVTHIIRNAIDHGIESKEERIQKGKMPFGNLRISARLSGGNVEILISDDGKGLDTEKIREKVVQKNLATFDVVTRSSKEELIEYLFMPGFSTAVLVTELSGRGVGLDVVRSNLKKIGGTVSIDYEENQGTTFTLSIPQTLSIVTCLIIKSANRKFAIPQQNLSELIRLNPTKIKSIENKQVYDLRNQLLPFVNISSLFQFDSTNSIERNEKFIVAVKSEKFYYGIAIDEVLDTEDIVVKPLGEYFEELGFLSGATILGDGDIALILDVSGVARLASMQNSQILLEDGRHKQIASQKENYLLFSVGKTKVCMSIVTNPYIVQISKNEIERYLGLDTFLYNKVSIPILYLNSILRLDSDDRDSSNISMILYKTNNGLVAIAATSVEGVVDDLEAIRTDQIIGEGFLGTAYRDGENVLILDVNYLLEEFYKQKLINIKLNIDDKKELLLGD